MSSRLAFAVPGDINTRTGGYVYDRRLLQGLIAKGHQVDHIVLGSSFPNPTAADTQDAASKLTSLASDCPVIVDGLALGALNPELVAEISAPLIALVHHPLAHEGGLEPARREYLIQTESQNLGHATRVIVTSPHTQALLEAEYGVPSNKITVALPGVDPAKQLAEQLDPPLILSVGVQLPRKGHDVLLKSLSQISKLRWQAVIAGAVLEDSYSQELMKLCQQLGLNSRVRFIGGVSSDELSVLYSQASVFALATRYEGYGMVFAEAMTYGLPIVSCNTGAVAETVAKGAGVLVATEDSEAFAEALHRILNDADWAKTLSVASRNAGSQLTSWQHTVECVEQVLDILGKAEQ